MPKMCEVPGCKEIGAHQFPRDAAVAKMWLKAIRRTKFKPERDSRICRNHFLETDYQKISIHTGTENLHRYLKKTAVPSVFIWTMSLRSQEAQARDERLLNRNIRMKLFTQITEKETNRSEDVSITENINVFNQDDHTIPDIAYEQYIESKVTTELEETIPIQNRSFGTQTSAVLRIFSTYFLQTDNESIMLKFQS